MINEHGAFTSVLALISTEMTCVLVSGRVGDRGTEAYLTKLRVLFTESTMNFNLGNLDVFYGKL